MTDAWICRELRDTDTAAVRRLLDSSDRDATLFVRREASVAATSAGWWYGAVGRTQPDVGAALQVEGTTGTLLEADPEATVALARGLLQHQQLIGKAGGERHVLRGLAAPMGRFWSVFQHVGRKVVADRTRVLHRAPAAPGPSRLDVRPGDAMDLKLVGEFLGEAVLETRGFDPRRTARDAHDRRCVQLLREGRCVVARDGGTAVLVAELVALDDRTVLLEPWFVPRPLRARKRLIAQALAPLPGLAPLAGREVLAFAEGAELLEALALAGWQPRATYRTIEMQG